jgi:hypothetical protein
MLPKLASQRGRYYSPGLRDRSNVSDDVVSGSDSDEDMLEMLTQTPWREQNHGNPELGLNQEQLIGVIATALYQRLRRLDDDQLHNKLMQPVRNDRPIAL